MNHFIRLKSGFTLIELLIVISMIAIFVSMAAGYNRNTDKQITLYREQGKVINAFYRARSLAIATYSQNPQSPDACGYGIHIASSTALVIFKDLPASDGKCKIYAQPTGIGIYDGAEEDLEVINLSGVSFGSGSENTDVLFVPPNPDVFSNKTFPVTFSLSAPGVSSSLQISINQFGQIIVQ
jgi:prepilin-type N-terminal cleavage/methylation domain-containing protein